MARKKVDLSNSRYNKINQRAENSGRVKSPDKQDPCSSGGIDYVTRNSNYARSKQNDSKDDYFDKNDNHLKKFSDQLRTIGLEIRNIPGDGNCLFRALCDQLEGHTRNHLLMRAEIVRYMVKNRVDFEPFIEDDVPFEKYMENLGKNGTFGGQHVLVAFSRMRNANIVIHQLSSPIWQINGGTVENCPELHLSYHNGEHYSSVRKLGDESEAPADVKLNLSSMNGEQSQENQPGKKSYRSYSPDYCANFIDDEYVEDIVDLDEKIQAVMHISGCQDVNLVRQSLADVDYNVEESASRVTCLLLLSETNHQIDSDFGENCQDKSPVDPVVALCEISPSPVKPKPDCGSGGAKPKKTIAPTKHLSNKQRKDAKRQERQQRLKDKVTSNSDSTPTDNEQTTSVSSLGCLNL